MKTGRDSKKYRETDLDNLVKNSIKIKKLFTNLKISSKHEKFHDTTNLIVNNNSEILV